MRGQHCTVAKQAWLEVVDAWFSDWANGKPRAAVYMAFYSHLEAVVPDEQLAEWAKDYLATQAFRQRRR